MSMQGENLTPADQANPQAGRGGVIPPPEHQFKPGQSGNPAGRPPNAGATLREHINDLAHADLTEDELRRVARDKRLPWTRRAAAERILRTIESGDIADYEPILKGQKSPAELRSEGVNTEMIKKIKPTEHGIEIELHDRAGEDFDRIIGHTDGKPTQRVEMDAKHAVAVKEPIVLVHTAPPERIDR
jgi:hypothetical protein